MDLRGKHQALLKCCTILSKIVYKIQNDGEFLSSTMTKGQLLKGQYPKQLLALFEMILVCIIDRLPHFSSHCKVSFPKHTGSINL